MNRKLALVLLSLLMLASCSGHAASLALESAGHTAATGAVPQGGPPAEAQAGSGLPLTPPLDSRRPWEALDRAGRVQPDGTAVRGVVSINAQTVFAAGVQRDSAYGSVADLGEASALSSGSLAQKQSALAVYRLALGGVEPGVVAVDTNLHSVSGGSGQSQYYVALSDYTHGVWDWRGPFSDGQIRLAPKTGSSYLSPLGNLYVTIAVYNGAAVDVVGVGANIKDAVDTTPPPVPGGLTATPIAGGLELQWNDVLAADLAGYRIYYSKSSISNLASAAVKHVPYLEGTTRFALTGISGATFVRVTAVDITGNESAVSNQGSATPLPGNAPQLSVSTDIPSGTAGASATLSVSGASSYDADLNGDGVFEITGSAATTYQIDTSQTGLLRPRIRASGSGTAVAYGGVSLLISANFPPVAKLTVTPKTGTLWGGDQLDVTFDASASTDDGGAAGLQYAYDPEGDGTFGSFTGGTSVPRFYSTAGTYLGAVEVKDSAGLLGYAAALCSVRQADGFETKLLDPNDNDGNGYYAQALFVNGNPAIAYRRDNSNNQIMYVRATDPQGRHWGQPVLAASTSAPSAPALAIVGGHPALAFFDSNLQEVRYVRALDADGTDWSGDTIDVQMTFAGLETCMLEVSGSPAVAWINSGTIYYKRGNALGENLADWLSNPQVVESNVNGSLSLLLAAGRPSVCFAGAGGAMYERAADATGNAFTSWAASAFTLSGAQPIVTGRGISIALVGGNPAVCYLDDMGANQQLMYTRSSTASGAAPVDWFVAVPISPVLDNFHDPSLCEVDGRPLLAVGGSIFANAELLYSIGADPDGSAWSNLEVAGSLGAQHSQGIYNSALGSPGWCGIATVCDDLDNSLDFDTLKYN